MRQGAVTEVDDVFCPFPLALLPAVRRAVLARAPPLRFRAAAARFPAMMPPRAHPISRPRRMNGGDVAPLLALLALLSLTLKGAEADLNSSVHNGVKCQLEDGSACADVDPGYPRGARRVGGEETGRGSVLCSIFASVRDVHGSWGGRAALRCHRFVLFFFFHGRVDRGG